MTVQGAMTLPELGSGATVLTCVKTTVVLLIIAFELLTKCQHKELQGENTNLV